MAEPSALDYRQALDTAQPERARNREPDDAAADDDCIGRQRFSECFLI
jgi:hypothetical protein